MSRASSLERFAASAAVLMASVPAGGTFRPVCRVAARHPVLLLKMNLLLSLRPLISTAELAREWFFTPDTPQAIVDRCLARLQDESYPAFLETIIRPPHQHRVRAPVLVLGAGRDGFFTVGDIRRTAHAYGTEPEIFPTIGHDMMLDEAWPLLADRIDGWIREMLTAPSRQRSSCTRQTVLRTGPSRRAAIRREGRPERGSGGPMPTQSRNRGKTDASAEPTMPPSRTSRRRRSHALAVHAPDIDRHHRLRPLLLRPPVGRSACGTPHRSGRQKPVTRRRRQTTVRARVRSPLQATLRIHCTLRPRVPPRQRLPWTPRGRRDQ